MYKYSTISKIEGKTNLVVMFHGYGQDETYFNTLITSLPQNDIAYISVKAPLANHEQSRYWFPLITSPNFTIEQVTEVTTKLINWLEKQKNYYQKIFLLGFSQGTEVISTILRHRPDLLDGLIMLSGIIITQPYTYFKDKTVLSYNLPVFLGVDPNDYVLPTKLISDTKEWLIKYTDVTIKYYYKLGHRISDKEANDIANFLIKTIA